MTIATNLGFPRIGANRELKKLVESFWAGKLNQPALLASAKVLRQQHWKLQQDAGLDHIPSNDFSFYDQVLDHSLLFGAIPGQYSAIRDDLTIYYAMARGLQLVSEGVDVPAMEMKKWLDTNYHFIVPEFGANQTFELHGDPKPVAEFKEALELGIKTRPVLLGPVSYLYLGKCKDVDPLSFVDRLVPLYETLIERLGSLGAEWIQVDEPILSLDLDLGKLGPIYQRVYGRLHEMAASNGVKILLTNYFGSLGENAELVLSLPVDGVHLDCVRAPQDLELASQWPQHMYLSLGLVNGRNVWLTDLEKALASARQAQEFVGDRLMIGPSCSLLHSPFSTKAETKMDSEVLSWMSFAVEKLSEIKTLCVALEQGDQAVVAAFKINQERRQMSAKIHNRNVQVELDAVDETMMKRVSPFPARYAKQQAILNLPLYPTTTIGSFPQTKELRVMRQKFKKGEVSVADYDEFIRNETVKCLRLQEEIGLDVLVHGESERNDMVEYFGEHLQGYVFSENGWVQSYGSRCVKPPIIFGDVSRPKPMTVNTAVFAQANSNKPVKGMLTGTLMNDAALGLIHVVGPVTMLQWSFVRDDQPRSVTTFQLALAIRKEVQDLEAAGIKVIQIDEPAIREGLPLRHSEWDTYLKWAVDSFLLASTGVRDETQVHSHFCYSDFNDIFPSIQRLDADVITIENARSDLKLLQAFKTYKYENAIGPGVYDIHSPRIPSVEEIRERLDLISRYVDRQLLWCNPDCGLKTRGAYEVVESLKNMVQVAKELRA